MGIKHVRGSTTSTNGCKVEIDGDIIYTLIPLRISGFNGIVHIRGGAGCPNGDLCFGTEMKGKVEKVSRTTKKKP
jgi:hypothetical protein